MNNPAETEPLYHSIRELVQLEQLASRLTSEFGKGFDITNLRNMRRFFQAFPIQETVSPELSWSHYNQLARLKNPAARQWYQQEAIQQHWRVRDPYLLDFLNLESGSYQEADLKLNKLSHQDVGQMDMYVRLYEEQKRNPDDNPSIGLILCSEHNHTVAQYSVLKDSQQLFASRFLTVLPSEEELQRELAREQRNIEQQIKERCGDYHV